MAGKNCIIGCHINKNPSSPGRIYAMALTFDAGNPDHNLKVLERYTNAIEQFGKPLLDMIAHDSKCKKLEMKYFDKKYYKRVPTLIIFKKQAQVVEDYMAELKKIESEILRTQSLSSMIDISDQDEITRSDKMRFDMKKEIRNTLEENVVVEAVKDDTGTKFLKLIESMGAGMMSQIKQNVIEVRDVKRAKEVDEGASDGTRQEDAIDGTRQLEGGTSDPF